MTFANAYIACNRNGTQAALRARLASNKKNAASVATRYLKDERVLALIVERTAKVLAPLALGADETLRKLAQMVRLNPKRLFDKDGDLLPVHLLPDEVAECIDAIDVDTVLGGRGKAGRVLGTVKLKLSKKATAVEMAMRHHGLFPRDEGQRGDPDEIARLVRERLGQIDDLTGKKGG